MATFDRRMGKDGRYVYRARVRRKGYPQQVATFHKLSDAHKWAQITEAAILEGRFFKSIEAKRHTLADLIDRYTQEILPHKAYLTSLYQSQQLRWWKVQLGHFLLTDVTPSQIAECRDRLAKDRANSTVRRYLAALSHTFTVAVREWEWLEESPMVKVRKPPEPKGRVRFLSDDERDRLLQACRESRNPHLYCVVVLALSTGARKNELVSLTLSQLDLQRGAIYLDETKNGDRRTLHITGYALSLLRQHVQKSRTDTDLVFPRRDGKKPIHIREAWENAVARAEIEDFTFHDLRHSFSSYLAMSGASLAEIAEILGHKTLEMAKKYTHLTERHTSAVVARMNEAIFGKSY